MSVLSGITKHTENNYRLPELNTIPNNLSQLFSFKLKTNNPYTEIYKLAYNFTEIGLETRYSLSRAEKKIALLTIDFDGEIIDLSNTDIQYFIDTFKNCPNLKEIRYPDSVEYK